jgi:hypothetical protein
MQSALVLQRQFGSPAHRRAAENAEKTYLFQPSCGLCAAAVERRVVGVLGRKNSAVFGSTDLQTATKSKMV